MNDALVHLAPPLNKQRPRLTDTEFQATSNSIGATRADDAESDVTKDAADEKLHQGNSMTPWFSSILSETAGRRTQLLWQPLTRY